jgi:hypothetical protein
MAAQRLPPGPQIARAGRQPSCWPMTRVQAHPGDVRAAFVVERAAATVASHWKARANCEWNGSAARLLALVLGQRALLANLALPLFPKLLRPAKV